MLSFSQYNQDYFVDKLFKSKRNGLFVDIGANDGIISSNSYLFEKYRDWDGICIEPHIEKFEELIKTRKCILENCCISEKNEVVTFRKVYNSSALSGILEFMSDRFKRRIDRRVDNCVDRYEDIELPAFTLCTILDKHNVTQIDFCSIDVEGAEWSIIKSIDFVKYKIGVFCIEGRDERIKHHLESNGYRCFMGTVDNYYVRRDFHTYRTIIFGLRVWLHRIYRPYNFEKSQLEPALWDKIVWNSKRIFKTK